MTFSTGKTCSGSAFLPHDKKRDTLKTSACHFYFSMYILKPFPIHIVFGEFVRHSAVGVKGGQIRPERAADERVLLRGERE